MPISVNSLHHVTATVEDAQDDLDFFAKLLGLRLVKRTVNFDNPGVYHFYYGDSYGSPGTIMTTFPYKGKGVREGEKGAGQVTSTSFSIPLTSLEFWRERLSASGAAIGEIAHRFEEDVIVFSDPSGLVLELIACDDDRNSAWIPQEIGGQHAIRGVHSVTMQLRELEPTIELLTEHLGFEVLGTESERTRLVARTGGAGRTIDLLHVPAAPDGLNGTGTVHHVALAVATDDEQLTIQDELRTLGFNVTDVRDRQYFRSIYFREPGGVLLEIATEGPGFLEDEARDALGSKLRLPPWEEHRRREIEAALPPIEL